MDTDVCALEKKLGDKLYDLGNVSKDGSGLQEWWMAYKLAEKDKLEMITKMAI